MKFKIGNRVRVIDQEITGIILAINSTYDRVLIKEDSFFDFDGCTGWEENPPAIQSVHKEADLVRSEGLMYT